MVSLQSLVKDTAIYGLSSIIGRFLNYFLVPLYTAKLSVESGGYGIITNVYAYVALLLVVLTYGMETTFFRFANKEGEDPGRVYSTTLLSVGATSLLFVAAVLVFLQPVSAFMGYASNPSFVWTMAAVVAMDAFQCVPFAYLRMHKRPVKFAFLKLLFIVLNIVFNLLAFLVLPLFTGEATPVGYAFYINLLCTSVVMLCFRRELTGFKYVFDADLWRRMMRYTWPILVLGVAGILNQTADKILFPYLYPGADGHSQLGIYGAATKIAMIMAMITQAFRYAYEPFVFGKAKEKDSTKTYATAMKYFVIFTLLAFLVVTAYLDILRYIIERSYWEGLKVVPIVMAAEIMMGVYFNLSFWYKLIDKTIWGAVFSAAGCLMLILVNVLFVPRYGYMACAWGGFVGYGTAMLLSYFVGQRKNPIDYPVRRMLGYTLLAVAAYVGIAFSNEWLPVWASLTVNTVLVGIFAAVVVKYDFPLKRLPVVGKYF